MINRDGTRMDKDSRVNSGKDVTVGVRSVERALDILTCLRKAELSLSEISREVDLNKATVFRMLASLERKGFVCKDGNSGRYSLDWMLWELLSDMLTRNQGLVNIAYPFMEKLWKYTGETITLYVRKGINRLCIAELPSPQPLKYTTGIGVTPCMPVLRENCCLLICLPKKLTR